MVPPEYLPANDIRAGMHPATVSLLASMHPFFLRSQPPEAPLSEDDLALFMLLVTYSDALDALPLEFTRSFSDLRELDAVLGAHLGSLTHRLRNLAAVIENPNVPPSERFLALKEVAEEARAYKMGGEDKIRVAVNTAEMIASHSDYIDSLLRSLTSLPALGPIVQEYRPQFPRLSKLSSYPVDRDYVPPPGALAHPGTHFINNPMDMHATTRGSRKLAQEPLNLSRARERDAQDASRHSKKRKVIPSGATYSSSGKARASANEPRTQNKRRDGRRGWNEDDDDESSDAQSEAYEGSEPYARFTNRSRGRGAVSDATGQTWSGRGDGSYDENGYDNTQSMPSDTRSGARGRPSKSSSGGSNRDDADDQRYCFCNNVSYGDMIGCDDDDCEREWFHLGCVGLSKPPQGTWYCDACLERRTQQARNKAKRGSRPARASGTPEAASATSRRVSATRK